MMTEYHKYQHIQEQIEREQAAKKVPPDADKDGSNHAGDCREPSEKGTQG